MQARSYTFLAPFPHRCGCRLAVRSIPGAHSRNRTAWSPRYRCGRSHRDAPARACTTSASCGCLMADVLLEAENLGVSFRADGGRTLRAVDNLGFRLEAGEVLGLVGESGCGKSTVARCVAGLLAPTNGVVRLDGSDVGVQRTAAQRRAVQMVFQDPYSSLNPRMTSRQTPPEPPRR